ncbi:TerC family protein [Devosia sp. YIM 151766]|uniref:TerC family protein n=1 Tax=Devosia sp. YIM 151766 TaxID=3017325 RepID=UPI00255CCD95|nr:TerC family protein [Devosia sp. YIM 151766]WIY51875.1 TerC family protein [Devosia sp. YIM 151766]
MESLLAALSGDFLGTPVYFWVAFIAIVIGLLVFDLGILHREEHEIETKESLLLYGFYVCTALAFGAWVWFQRGAQAGLEFYTGYLIEQSLAMDNMFVIATIFGFLGIPRLYQHRVLFWGILGVILFRAVLIGVGAALVNNFNWVLFFFGAFLVFTGIRMFSHSGDEPNMEDNKLLKFLRGRFRITKDLRGRNFTVREPDPKTGAMVTWLTPLAVALIMVEFVDLIFAVDSVPAVFAVTQDTFIVYTSNIFAILGLRALYFALAAAMNRFRYLQISLAIILVLIGIKIFLVPMNIHIDTLLSLIVTLSILAGGVLYSLWKTRNEPNISAEDRPETGQLEP